MKRKTLLKKLELKGYRIVLTTNGFDIYDDFGWRAFISDNILFGLNTCSIELPQDDFNMIIRYVRTPLNKR